MTTLHLDLNKYLSGHVFGFLFIFSRVGCIMMLFPGIGESYVASRFRLMLALAISFLLLGPLLPRIPAEPAAIADLMAMICYEMIIGLFFGTLLRFILSTLEATGSVIALQTGLSNATILSPSLAVQSPLVNAFLTTVGVTLLFVSGMDHMLLRSLVAVYDVFPPNGTLMPGDMAQTIIQLANRSFVVGVELAMPFLVIGILMYVAMGIMQKLMPQVQLFLIALPVQIWGGFALLGITIAGIMTIWMQYVDQTIGSVLAR